VGNLSILTYPDNKQVQYGYDANNRLETVTDWANRVTRYSYDENGRLTETQRPNGTVQTRGYDAKGQLLQLKDADAQGAVIVQYDFSYDASGNIVEEKVTPTPQAFPLSSADMSYGAANRLATYEGQAAQFDEDGNLTFGPLDGTMASFTYDSKRRLIQAGSTTYQYDAENHRIGIHQTQFVVNSQPALSQTLVKTENGSSTYYVYGLGLIGEESSNTYQSYHFDFRGSTVALSDTSGGITERFQYSAYGVLVAGDISKTPFLFNGAYGVMTDSNRLYHMRARFYNPEIRRFLNRDVLWGRVFDGRSLNRFAYVMGDPVKYTDPFGLDRLCGPGEKAIPDPDQPHVSYCKRDGSDPNERICVTPECLLRCANQGGNDAGPAPYVGAGHGVDWHFIFVGLSSSIDKITQGDKTCTFRTDCSSWGLGLNISGSLFALPIGIALRDNNGLGIVDIEDSLPGRSDGLSIDYGCFAQLGLNLSMGHDEQGITSFGNASGLAKASAGCGAAIAWDICETKVLSCSGNK